MKGKPVSEEQGPISAPASIQLLLDSIKKTRNWNVFCLRVNEAGVYSDNLVESQIDMFCLNQLVAIKAKCDVDILSGITYEEFIVKYGNLIATVGGSRVGTLPAEQVRQFISNRLWPEREVAFGSSILYLSLDRWQWVYSSMKRLEEKEFTPVTEQFPPNAGEYDANIANWNRASVAIKEDDTYSEYSDAPSQNESEFQFGDGRKQRNTVTDMEMGGIRKTAEINVPIKKEIIEKQEKVTNARKSWVGCTWLLTFWIPSFFLSCCGKLKRPDIRMAWREKVALCLIIAAMCLSLLFLIIGLRYVICPPVAVFSQEEVRSLKFGRFGGSPKAWFSLYGVYIYAGDLMASHIKSYGDGTGPGAIPNFLFEDLYGQDVSKLFYRQDSWNYYCPNLPAPTTGWDNLDQQLSWQRRTGILPQILSAHRSTAVGVAPPLYSDNLYQYAKGKVGWTKESVKALSSDNQVIAIHNSRFMLYSLTMYITSPNFFRRVLFHKKFESCFHLKTKGKISLLIGRRPELLILDCTTILCSVSTICFMLVQLTTGILYNVPCLPPCCLERLLFWSLSLELNFWLPFNSELKRNRNRLTSLQS
jgi:chitin synthase